MHRFMVLSSIYFERKDSATSVTRWSYSLPTFYVHAADGKHAQQIANEILTAGRNDPNFKGTSGSTIAYDDNGNPIETSYHSWSCL